MWIDCYEVFVNMDKVDYISFGVEDCDGEEVPTAYLYLTNRLDPLKLHSESLEGMVKYFAKCTVGEIDETI